MKNRRLGALLVAIAVAFIAGIAWAWLDAKTANEKTVAEEIANASDGEVCWVIRKVEQPRPEGEVVLTIGCYYYDARKWRDSSKRLVVPTRHPDYVSLSSLRTSNLLRFMYSPEPVIPGFPWKGGPTRFLRLVR